MSKDKNKPPSEDLILKEFQDLFSGELKAPVDPKLTEVTVLEAFDKEKYQLVIPMLKAAYGSDNPTHRRFGCILNAIYTQGTPVFVLTKDLADKLAKKDTNFEPSSCNTESYKKLMHFMLGKGLIKELRPPVRNDKGIPGKAGLYELIDKRFLAPLYLLVGEAACIARKESVIKWYDENDKYKEQPEEKPYELGEYSKEMKRLAAEKKNKNGK